MTFRCCCLAANDRTRGSFICLQSQKSAVSNSIKMGKQSKEASEKAVAQALLLLHPPAQEKCHQNDTVCNEKARHNGSRGCCCSGGSGPAAPAAACTASNTGERPLPSTFAPSSRPPEALGTGSSHRVQVKRSLHPPNERPLPSTFAPSRRHQALTAVACTHRMSAPCSATAASAAASCSAVGGPAAAAASAAASTPSPPCGAGGQVGRNLQPLGCRGGRQPGR